MARHYSSLAIVFMACIYCSWVAASTDFCKEVLGLESRVIDDSQITAATARKGHEAKNARLRNSVAWCADGGASRTLQVDLRQVMGITRIATQGEPAFGNYITKYFVKYGFDGSETYYVMRQNSSDRLTLDGNSDTRTVNYTDFGGARFTGQYIVINPSSFEGSTECLRLELYGCPEVCSGGLGFENGSKMPEGSSLSASSHEAKKEPSKARLHALSEWCANNTAANTYLDVDLGKVMIVTGIATQGSHSTDNKVENFLLQYGDTKETFATFQSNGKDKTFIGNKNATSVIVNWLLPSIEARYIRIRPVNPKQVVCMRLEIIGCPNDQIKALGLETKVIVDAKLTGSSLADGNQAFSNGRLNHVPAWCGKGKGRDFVGNEWLTVDLGRPMTVTALSTQGDPNWGLNIMKSLIVEHSFDGSSWRFVKNETQEATRIFPGPANNLAAKFNAFVDQKISARHLRFRSNEYSGEIFQCLRVEVYGYPQYCTGTLGIRMGSQLPNSLTLTASNGKVTPPTGRLGSFTAWCAVNQDKNQFFQVNFATFITANGIALQGSPTEDSWVTKFNIQYGEKTSSLSTITNGSSNIAFQLSGSRDKVIHVWFPSAVLTKIIKLIPLEFKNKICLRMDVLGCDNSCIQKRGMESGGIPNSAISASSALDANSLSQHSRLNVLKKAWRSCRQDSCKQGKKETGKEWIQVCLDKVKTISGLLLQGGGDSTSDKITRYSLLYLYEVNGQIFHYKMSADNQVFKVVLSRYSTSFMLLPIRLTARCLRLQVESYEGTSAALRWELLGCSDVGKPSLNLPSEKTVERKGKVTISCDATGQSGIIFRWTKDDKTITGGDIYSFTSKDSDGSLSGVTKLILEVTAVPSKLLAKGDECLLDKGSKSIFTCSSVLKCSVYYLGTTATNKKSVTLKVTGVIGKSTKPQSMSTDSLTTTSATIRWKQPQDVGDFSFEHYRVVITNKEKTITNTTTSSLSMTVKSLTPSTEYSVSITYVNAKIIASDPLTGTFRTEVTSKVATAPRNVNAKSAGPTSITFTWNQPASINGVLHDYRIRYNIKGSNINQNIDNVDKSAVSYTVTNLQPFTTYQLKIRAFTNGGLLRGIWSNTVEAQTDPGAPTAPRNLKIDVDASDTDISLTASWMKPDPANAIITGYKVSVGGSKSYNVTFKDEQQLVTTKTSIKVTAFGGAKYVVGVSALASEIQGNELAQIVVTPSTTPPKPTSIISSYPHGTSITLHSSSDINGPPSQYNLSATQSSNCSVMSKIIGEDIVTPQSLPKTIKIRRGKTLMDGVNIVLPLVGNITFCYRAFTSNKDVKLAGSSHQFIIERRSLASPSPVVQSSITTTSFGVELVKGTSSAIRYYQVCVVELKSGTTDIQIDPSLFPPSKLASFNPQTHSVGIPYIAAEFDAQDFDKYRQFTVGDNKTYSKSKRTRRSNSNDIIYRNAELKTGATYAVFQRALETDLLYYTTPWIGPISTRAVPKIAGTTDEAKSLPIIIGSVAAVVSVAAVILIAICVIRRRRKNKQDTKDTPFKMEPIYEEIDIQRVRGHSNPIPISDFDWPPRTPIQVTRKISLIAKNKDTSDYEVSSLNDEHLCNGESNSSDVYESLQKSSGVESLPVERKEVVDFEQEFKSMQFNTPKIPKTLSAEGRKTQNSKKNRDMEIIPKDEFRVVLDPVDYEYFTGDYINATMFNGYTPNDSFIASQYPLPHTITDFWAMIYQNQSGILVILNNTREGDQEYPPILPEEGDTKEIGRLKISLMSKSGNEMCSNTKVLIENKNTPRSGMDCDVFHYHLWPNHGVPNDPYSLLVVLNDVAEIYQSKTQKCPITVICSDGAGRTGCLITIFMALEQFRHEGNFNIMEILTNIRFYRPEFVSNTIQYKFCNEVLDSYRKESSSYGYLPLIKKA